MLQRHVGDSVVAEWYCPFGFKELEATIAKLQSEKSDVLNQSLMVSEENEARLQNIRNQEVVSFHFVTNFFVSVLSIL